MNRRLIVLDTDDVKDTELDGFNNFIIGAIIIGLAIIFICPIVLLLCNVL